MKRSQIIPDTPLISTSHQKSHSTSSQQQKTKSKRKLYKSWFDVVADLEDFNKYQDVEKTVKKVELDPRINLTDTSLPIGNRKVDDISMEI